MEHTTKVTTKPEISVVMAAYNRAETFLKEAIESVLSQSFKDFELIIVDDCSPDNTKQVVADYMKKDSRVRYIRHDKNFGMDTKPKNTGVLASEGRYIAYCDDDAVWMPYHLEVLHRAFEQDPELDVAYCDMIVKLPDGKMEKGIALDFDGQFLLRRNFIDTSEAMHKREMIFNIGGWDESIRRFTDWNLWVRMMKWGAKFQRVPVDACIYNVHENTQSHRKQVRTWKDPYTGMVMFEPTFDPAGCPIFMPYLIDIRAEMNPRVAIYTITYDRLDYSKRMQESLKSSTNYPFDWFIWDNGSTDGTPKWLSGVDAKYIHTNKDNVGITKASNALLDEIMKGDYQLVIKVDNDCEFTTKNWLNALVDLWKRNHLLYMSPYVEGLVDNPGGSPRIGYSYVGPYFVEVTTHIGGICAAIDSHAYKNFRFTDQFKHGNQDSEASQAFRELGYMPCYVSVHKVLHMDTTAGQKEKYPDYFERRRREKTEVA